MTSWALAAAAAWAVLRLAVRRPWPARVPAPGREPSGRAGPGPRPARRAEPRVRGAAGTSGGATPSDLVACCDLLAVAASAGCSLRQAIDAVGASGRGPVAAALARAGQEVDRGAPLDVAVEALADRVGDQVRPLVSTLVVAAGAGTAVAPALQRLADAERRRSRRAVEARVRRLPVLLLVPLVTCILPAFVLMTLVPVGLAASRSGLALVASPRVQPSGPSASPSVPDLPGANHVDQDLPVR